MNYILHIAPRALGILAILFISLFALDAIGAGRSAVGTLVGLGIHLIPSAILALLLWFAWKYELWGGILFICVSFAPFILLSNPPSVNTMLGGPFFLTGVLFVAEHYFTHSRRTG